MSRPHTPRRLARLASAALTGALAATCLLPTAASAAAPPAVIGWEMGSSNGAFAFSTTTGSTGTVWSDGSRKTAIKQGTGDVAGRVSAWSSDGNRVLVTAAGNKTVLDVNPWKASLVETFADPDGNEIRGVSLSPDGLKYAWGTPGQGFRTGTPYEPATTVMPHGSAGTAWSKSDRLAWINDDADPGETNDDPGIFVASGASETPFSSLHMAVLSDPLIGERPQGVSLSADGARLAYSTPDSETHTDAIRVSSADNSSDPRFLELNGAPTAQDRFAAMAPDGSKVAFVSDRSGAWAIYTANWDGTGVSVVPNTTLPSGQAYTGLAWQPSQVPYLVETEISSATEVGSTLTANQYQEQGTAPLERTYRWQRCDDGTPASCVDTGVTTEGFPLNDTHVGHRYRVVRTVTNAAGTDTRPSLITTAIVQPVAPDTEAPMAPDLYGRPASPSRFATATFGWNGAEQGGTFACSLDGAAFKPCTAADEFPLSGDGQHSFRVRQIDAANNPGEFAEHLWTVDTTAPAKPTIGTKPPTRTKATSAEITFSGDETDGTFECRRGDGAWDACSSPLQLTNLSDGEQRVYVRQLDEAGNASDAVEVKWTVDTAVPAQPEITTDLAGVRTSSSVEIAFTGEPGATFACSIEDGAFAACTSPAKLDGLATGPHRFAVRQTDAAGNTGAPREAAFTVDVTGPAKPTFTGKPDAFVKVSKAVFTWTGADPDGAGFECAIEGIPGWDPCESGDDVDGLPEGTHTFLVRQIDAHGNRGEIAAHTWRYDATKPVAPTLKGDLDVVRAKETTVGFSGEGSEGSTFECRLDEGVWEACTSPATLKDYAQGPHTFEVREIDAAGNVGATAGDFWTADFSGPPAPKVKTGPDARTEQTTATVDLTVADPHGTTEYALDGGAWTATKLPLTLTGLAVGDHVLLVRQTDAAGNHGKATTIAWTIVAPTATPVETPTAEEKAPAAPQAPAQPQTPAPAPVADKPAATPPAKAPAPAAQPKLSAVIGGAPDRGAGSGGTSSAATITVKRDGVGVGCAITGTVLTSCKVDLYVAAASSRAAGTTPRQVLVGTGEYRAKAGSRKMEVAVTLNATGRKLLRSAPEGLKVSVAITGRPVEGKPLKATGAATLVLGRTTATVGGFAINSADLTAGARRQLTALAKQVRGTAVSLRVVGHTDGSTTDADYLKGLGMRRAQAVAAFVRAHGVQAKATLVSRGATQPRATNGTKPGRALNRRVELRIAR